MTRHATATRLVVGPLVVGLVLGTLSLFPAVLAHAGDAHAGESSRAAVERRVREVTAAQNRATTRGANRDDVERLYAMYSADFVYEHPMMDDSYTRQQLLENHLAGVDEGRYERLTPEAYGYRIVGMMHGDDAVAVLRSNAQMEGQPPRMAVFEFRDGKVSRIREYWNY
ncbi:hypothetical protein FKV24_001655 [Lysobacter maris]|uniref:Uncharacterized protein n=1 Tax=Marilutibacter maris TaxID=1605891 RepID=A0A508B1C5_9GAMM|nr:nuclear transport factor 2 family protein [Lysobacter maris]KAB8198535.1 hypothetical protein FKV24_001655 [Lysobacter maris]